MVVYRIYRVIHFFSMGSSHSYPLLLLGFTIEMKLCINCITCFFLLATYHGFCDNCNNNNVYYDWRSFIWHKVISLNIDLYLSSSYNESTRISPSCELKRAPEEDTL